MVNNSCENLCYPTVTGRLKSTNEYTVCVVYIQMCYILIQSCIYCVLMFYFLTNTVV